MGKKTKDAEVKASANTSAPSEKSEANLEPTKTYNVVAIVSTKYFKEGFEMRVLGDVAERMINNNQVKLKE